LAYGKSARQDLYFRRLLFLFLGCQRILVKIKNMFLFHIFAVIHSSKQPKFKIISIHLQTFIFPDYLENFANIPSNNLAQ